MGNNKSIHCQMAPPASDTTLAAGGKSLSLPPSAQLIFNNKQQQQHNFLPNHDNPSSSAAEHNGLAKTTTTSRRLEDIKIFWRRKPPAVPASATEDSGAKAMSHHRFLGRKLKSYFHAATYKNLDSVDSAAASVTGRSKSSNAFVYEEYYDLIVGSDEKPPAKTSGEESFYESTIELDRFAAAAASQKLVVSDTSSNLYSMIALNAKHKKASRPCKTKKLNAFLLASDKARKPFSFFLAKTAAPVVVKLPPAAELPPVVKETAVGAQVVVKSMPQVPAKCFDPLKEFSQQSSSSDLQQSSSGVSSMTSRLSGASLGGAKPAESILKMAPPQLPVVAVSLPPVDTSAVFYQSLDQTTDQTPLKAADQYQPDYESIRIPPSDTLTKRSSSRHSKSGGGKKKLMSSYEQLLDQQQLTNQIYYSFIEQGSSSLSLGSSLSLA